MQEKCTFEQYSIQISYPKRHLSLNLSWISGTVLEKQSITMHNNEKTSFLEEPFHIKRILIKFYQNYFITLIVF